MAGIIEKTLHIFTMNWATGPIFDKELRVASRRKRFYLLRSIYLILLMILMAIVWATVTGIINSVQHMGSAYYVSRMAEASKIIAASIAWFQFISAQLIVIVICSTAVNSEIYNRTLYVLMTTPVTAFQIVVGKLTSRVLQILILLGVSLPLLATVRVFGGIPWRFLVETFCVTVSTVFFISAVTVFFSILLRRAYVVIIFTVLALAAVFALLPFMVVILCMSTSPLAGGWVDTIMVCMNPYVYMASQTNELFYSLGTLPLGYGITLCVLLVISALFILWASCRLVRETALKHMTPKPARKKYKIPPRQSKTYWMRRPFYLHTLVQRTIGTGMIWKEFLHPVLGRFRKLVFGALIALLFTSLLCVVMTAATGSLTFIGAVAVGSVFVLAALATLFTVVIPATYITSEKEAGTWQILLTTCYSDERILGGKIIGIMRRMVLAWLPFVIIFWVVSPFFENPMSLLVKLIFAASIAVGFVVASGLYFSSRFRHTTTAVICNISFISIIWVILPLIFVMIDEFSYYFNTNISRSWFRFMSFRLEDYWKLTPPGVIVRIMDIPDRIHWSGAIAYTILHLAAIGLFLWRTKKNLRKRIN